MADLDPLAVLEQLEVRSGKPGHRLPALVRDDDLDVHHPDVDRSEERRLLGRIRLLGRRGRLGRSFGGRRRGNPERNGPESYEKKEQDAPSGRTVSRWRHGMGASGM
jgi:hypothetical protein